MTLTRESKVRITSTAPPLMVRAIGWCEDCGDVEVQPMCRVYDYGMATRGWARDWKPSARCCHYADCPRCGEDVDQWAWT